MKTKRSTPEKVFTVFNYTIVTLFSLLTLYPFIYVLSASISSPDAVSSGKVMLWPVRFTFDNYIMLFKTNTLLHSFFNSVIYVVGGTLYAMTLNVLAAYPLSKKRLMGRSFFSLVLAFTMWFGGGMIPFYLLVKNMGMMNSRLGMIIPFGCAVYHIILVRTFFQSIPDSYEESAKIDGAGDFTVLFRIYMPLSVAVIATVSLYIIVDKWNAYFWGMVLLRDDNKIPLAVLLRNMVVKLAVNTSGDANAGITNLSYETMVYGTMMVAMVPMLILYPFVQKYFVKGIMIGGLKG